MRFYSVLLVVLFSIILCSPVCAFVGDGEVSLDDNDDQQYEDMEIDYGSSDNNIDDSSVESSGGEELNDDTSMDEESSNLLAGSESSELVLTDQEGNIYSITPLDEEDDLDSDSADSDSDTMDSDGISDDDDISVASVDDYDGITLFTIDYDYPSSAPLTGGCYMEVSTSQLGTVIIYIPFANQEKYFAFDTSGNVVNISNTTVTGIMYRGSTLYNVRWVAWSTPTYKLTTASTYSDLTITDVITSNVQIIEDGNDSPLYPPTQVLLLVVVLFGGVICCKLFMKR